MRLSVLLFPLMLGLPVFAAKKPSSCENMALYGAIRAYKAEMGTVQGSEGIGYWAHHVESLGSRHEYVVTIADNNEDGDVWEVDYRVILKSDATKCRVVSVNRLN